MRVLVFTLTNTRANELAQAFMCPAITGQTSPEDRVARIQRFNMDTPSILVAVISSMATGWRVQGDQPTAILFDSEIPEGPEREQARMRAVVHAPPRSSPYSDPRSLPCGEIVLPGGGRTTLRAGGDE